MKRRDLERHLLDNDCEFLRHGGSHDIWRNPANGYQSAVPRHRYIVKVLVRAICDQLDIPRPPGI